MGSVSKTTTDEAGRFSVADSPTARNVISVRHPGFAPLEIFTDEAPPPDSSGIVRIQLQPESLIEGTCRPVNGTLKEGKAYLTRKDSPLFGTDAVCDPSGKFNFRGLAAGEYYLAVHLETAEGKARMGKKVAIGTGESKKVDFSEGLGDLSVTGRALGDVDPLPYADVTILPEFEWQFTHRAVQTNAEGRYRIEGFKPGRYRIVVRSAIAKRFLAGDRKVFLDADATFDVHAIDIQAKAPAGPTPIPSKPIS